jgi:hypothetical protein
MTEKTVRASSPAPGILTPGISDRCRSCASAPPTRASIPSSVRSHRSGLPRAAIVAGKSYNELFKRSISTYD